MKVPLKKKCSNHENRIHNSHTGVRDDSPSLPSSKNVKTLKSKVRTNKEEFTSLASRIKNSTPHKNSSKIGPVTSSGKQLKDQIIKNEIARTKRNSPKQKTSNRIGGKSPKDNRALPSHGSTSRVTQNKLRRNDTRNKFNAENDSPKFKKNTQASKSKASLLAKTITDVYKKKQSVTEIVAKKSKIQPRKFHATAYSKSGDILSSATKTGHSSKTNISFEDEDQIDELCSTSDSKSSQKNKSSQIEDSENKLENSCKINKSLEESSNSVNLSAEKGVFQSSQTSSESDFTFEDIEKKIFEDKPPNVSKRKSQDGDEGVNKKAKVDSESDSEENDWEEVDELDDILSAGKDKSDSNVQIEMEDSSALWGSKKRKRRTHQEMVEDYIRKRINCSIKKVYENEHKLHLLCLIAHGRYVNSCLNSTLLRSCGLSLFNFDTIHSSTKRGISDVTDLLKEFRKTFTFFPEKQNPNDLKVPIEELLLKRFSDHIVCSTRELVFLFVIICRAVGISARFVYNIIPINWKPEQKKLIKPFKNIDVDQDEVGGPKGDTKTNTPKINNFNKMNFNDDNHSPKIKGKKVKPKLQSSSDDDFEDGIEFASSQKAKKKVKKQNKRKNKNSPIGRNKKKNNESLLLEWVEVYDCHSKKWCSIEVIKQTVEFRHDHIRMKIPSQSALVVAFNQDESLMDVTKRYVSNWLSARKKLCCDLEWWSDAISPFVSPKTEKYLEEEKQMNDDLLLQPLPKTLAAYKNHPLYVLQKDLLKYQAIYPPDESPVGNFRGMPVFPRDSVKTLRGRENWIRDAKTVIVDEEPYKIVNAIAKWDKVNRVVITDRPLELFGEWQVEDYVPPTAKNGKVPRNEFGNVELFKPSMLPFGCVYLQVAGLNRISRKLGIDCAAAVVGFEFGSRGCHPLLDGFVVCEEFKDVLMDAWKQDQLEQERKQEEKRIKTIYDNWKKLIKGLLVKERIKDRYGELGDQTQLGSDAEVKAAPKRKRITQQDISKLEEAPRPDPVNLSIDTATLAADATKAKLDKVNELLYPSAAAKKVAPKPSHKRKETSSVATPAARANLSSAESDEGEADEEQRKQKIRNILRWQPTTSQAALSDDSDSEKPKFLSKNEEDSVVSSEDELFPSVAIQEEKKGKLTNKPKNMVKGAKKAQNGNAASVAPKRSLSLRRPRRVAKKAQYDERSECELSFEDSDDDRSYKPVQEDE